MKKQFGLIILLLLIPLTLFARDLKTVKKELDRDPNSLRLLVEYAKLLGWNKKYSEAKNVYQKVLSIYPNHLEAMIGLGRVYAWQKQYDPAIKWLQKCEKYHPGAYEAQKLYGTVLMWQGKYPEAKKRFFELFKTHRDDLDLLLQIAKIHYYQGNNAAAGRTLRFILSKEKNEEASELLTRINYRLKFDEKAVIKEKLYELDLRLGYEFFSYVQDGQDIELRFRGKTKLKWLGFEVGGQMVRRFAEVNYQILLSTLFKPIRDSYINLGIFLGPGNLVLPQYKPFIETLWHVIFKVFLEAGYSFYYFTDVYSHVAFAGIQIATLKKVLFLFRYYIGFPTLTIGTDKQNKMDQAYFGKIIIYPHPIFNFSLYYSYGSENFAVTNIDVRSNFYFHSFGTTLTFNIYDNASVYLQYDGQVRSNDQYTNFISIGGIYRF